MRVGALILVGLLWVGCGALPEDADPDASPTSESPTPSENVSPTPEPCVREPGPADYTRLVFTAQPYDANANPSDVWRVWTLDTDGTLTRTDEMFTLGRATTGRMVFTPDGAIGVVPLQDGTLGVIDASGPTVEVIETSFHGDFYAGRVVMDPTGSRAYVLDTNWRENGGGIYVVYIDCDTGALSDGGMLAAARLPGAMQWLSDGRAVLAAEDVLDSPSSVDAHLLDFDGSEFSRLDSSDAYPDDEAIVSSLTVTADEQYALIGDNNAFSGIPNRVGVVHIAGDTLTTTTVISPLEDPISMVASPYGNVVLAVSGFGDALFELAYNPSATPPLRNNGEVTYVGASPALPGEAVMIDVGTLTGHVLIAENVGIHQVELGPGGVVDLGATTFGGLENIVGAIGVQP